MERAYYSWKYVPYFSADRILTLLFRVGYCSWLAAVSGQN